MVEALGERLSGIWTSRELAEAFLAHHPHLGMRVSALESRALKEAYLGPLGCSRWRRSWWTTAPGPTGRRWLG